MSPTPRQKCHPEQYKNNNTRENNTRAGARESVRDVLRESFPWNERLTEALLAFEESRAAGKHPLTVNAASLACNKLNQLADEAGVRDRYGYMAAVLEQSILRGWEGLFALKDDFVDAVPTSALPARRIARGRSGRTPTYLIFCEAFEWNVQL